MIDPNRLSQGTTRYRDLEKYFEKHPSLDSSNQVFVWTSDSRWRRHVKENLGYEVISYPPDKMEEEEEDDEYEEEEEEWDEDVLDDPRRLDWWKDFAVLYDERKARRKKRILTFLVKCWGDKDGINVLSVLIDYVVE